tara:strand:+ start:544 stop:951 length:408 start_codon:yes stop_codon:yes gene_type:complete
MTIIETDKSVKADSSKLDSSKTDSSKVTEVKKTKKVSNATQSKLIDLMKSNKKITLEDALKKLEDNNELASASNRTSSKNTDVMNEFKSEFDSLVDKFVKDKKFTKDNKRVTVLNVDKAIRIPKMYFATSKDSKK